MKKRILASVLSAFLLAVTANAFALTIGEGFGDDHLWFGEQSQTEEFEVSIYPNPNNGKFEILTNGSGEMKEVVIFNIIGEQVFYKKFEDEKMKLDLTQIDKGLYMMQIYNSERNEKLTKRFYIE